MIPMRELDYLLEKRTHGDVMLPLSVYDYTTDPGAQERLACHWHREAELLLCTQGRAVFHIDRESFLLQEGEAAWIRGNSLHAATQDGGMPFAFSAVVFDPDFLTDHANNVVSQNYMDPVRKGTVLFPSHLVPAEAYEKQVLEDIAGICRHYAERDDCWELSIKILLLEIWKFLFLHAGSRTDAGTGAADHRIVRIKHIMNDIREHSAEDITVAGLAEKYALSEEYFCRFFREMTHMSALDYVNTCRITDSCRLLLESDAPVSEIAGQVGYENISYFNRIFRRFMHQTPMEYRKGRRPVETSSRPS